MDGLSLVARENSERVERELSRLSDSDHLRLKRIAQLRALGISGLQWDDLLQEAIFRLLSGSRRCPNDVPFMACLVQTMRSIAHEARERGSLLVSADLGNEGALDSTIDDVPSNAPGPESHAATRDAIRAIEKLFASDNDAMTVLKALAQGWAPDETLKKTSMTLKRYQAAQKRIRRKIASAEALGELTK